MIHQTLTFDAVTHSYSLAGRPLPGVTSVINALLPGWQADDWYLQRGQALHHGCRLLDSGTLDWLTVHEQIRPRIKAWMKFTTDYPAEILAMEQPMASEKYGFAGTPDRVFLDPAGKVVVADIKSSYAAQARLQLGAYSLLVTDNLNRQPVKAVIVELAESGAYKTCWLDKWELRRAEQQFLAVLTVFNFAKQHNLLRGP